MSREQVAALTSWLEGLTFTDVGLVGGSAALAGKVAVLGPRSTYEVAIQLPIASHDEATTVGAEVLAVLAASLYVQLLGGSSFQHVIDGSSASYDHARRTLTVYAAITCTLIL